MTKTVVLDGTALRISGLGKNNTLVINNSNGPVYASRQPNIEAYADDVIEIPAGARDTVVGTNGTVYLLGSGRVELRGVDYVGFKQPSSSKSDGGGDKNNSYICGSAKFITDTDDLKSIRIENYSASAFATALAKETGWKISSIQTSSGFSGFNVISNNQAGFTIGSSTSYIYLANNTGYLYNSDFRYLERTDSGTAYYLDICKNPSGTAWAFGFRNEKSDVNLPFILAMDQNGNSVALSTYSTYVIYSSRADQTASRMEDLNGIVAATQAPTTLSPLCIVDRTITLSDIFLMYCCNKSPASGSGFVINGETFRTVRNRVYSPLPTLVIRTKSK